MTWDTNHELGVIPQPPAMGVHSSMSSDTSGFIYDQDQLYDKVAQMPIVSTPTIIAFLSVCTGTLEESSTISWQRRLGPHLQVVLHYMQAPLESGQLQPNSPFLGHP